MAALQLVRLSGGSHRLDAELGEEASRRGDVEAVGVELRLAPVLPLLQQRPHRLHRALAYGIYGGRAFAGLGECPLIAVARPVVRRKIFGVSQGFSVQESCQPAEIGPALAKYFEVPPTGSHSGQPAEVTNYNNNSNSGINMQPRIWHNFFCTY